MVDYTIDGDRIKSLDMVHIYLEEALDLPEYGRNLDGLWDTLSEMDGDININFINFQNFKDNVGDYADDLINVFWDACDNGYINFELSN